MSQKEPFKWRKAKPPVAPPAPKAQPVPARQPAEPAPAPAPPPAPAASAARDRETPAPTPSVNGPERPAAEPAHDQIAARAYELWEAQGWPHGADREHWLEAERQLRATRVAMNTPATGPGGSFDRGPAAGPGILTINGGSSSLKFALFETTDPLGGRLSGRIERVGRPDARFVAAGEDRRVDAPDQGTAASLVIDWLDRGVGFAAVGVIGFRVVHGGGRYHEPERVTPGLIAELRRISPIDPDHLPGTIALIEAFGRRAPGVPLVACFDTAFHHDLPRVARIVPIPRRFEAAGVRRYGFHGLSYASMMEELTRVGAPGESSGRVILAHLGSGASLAAVQGGRPVDTTMGFTPASGLVMGTRSGDIDPGLVRFLMRDGGLSAGQFDDLVNHESGLLGVSETSPDVRDLLARQGADARAAEAIDLFCYRAKTWVGAFAAALGGLDTLAFGGGIGENAPEIRRRICDGLGFLGVALDATRNAAGAPLISTDGAPTRVRVIHTDEERMIAAACARLAGRPPGG